MNIEVRWASRKITLRAKNWVFNSRFEKYESPTESGVYINSYNLKNMEDDEFEKRIGIR